MKKSRKEREIEQWAALEKMVDERDAIVMEVMQEVLAAPLWAAIHAVRWQCRSP